MNAPSDGEQRAEALNIIAETTTALSRCRDVDEVCALLGSTVHDFNADAYVVVSLFDAARGGIRIRALFGFGEVLDSLVQTLGRDPRRMIFSPEEDMTAEERRLFTSGKVERVNGGLHAVLSRKVPAGPCRAAEKSLGVDSVYAVGFALDGDPYGGLFILPPKGREVRYTTAIEALVTHAAVVVKHRRAERALRWSEERYRILVENQAEGIGFVDPQERFTFANPAAHGIFGVPPGSLAGRSLREFVDQETFAFVRKQTALRRQGKKSTYEIEIERPDGERRNLLVTGAPRFDGEGAFVGTVGLFRDVTERKRAEQALRESEARFRALTMSARDAIIMVNPEGAISLWNRAAEEIFGYTREEALGEDLHALLAPQASREAMQAAFSRFQRTESLECMHDAVGMVGVKKDGTQVPVEISLAPVELDGRWHAVAIVRDITERMHAEEEQQELEEQLQAMRRLESIGQLAGGVAHDFNNLLTPIMGYAQLIQGELSADSPVQEEVEEILDAADRARDLVRQLLAFGRRQMLRMKSLDLNEVISEFEPFLRRIIREDIDIHLELEPSLSRVRADASQMEQILMNLAANAQDAMPDGGEITIRTDNVCLDAAYARDHAEVEEGCYVMLSLSDTGIGMSEEVQGHLFEPFFTTKEVGEGTGMGLPTVYGIVKQHEGNIYVYSEEGEGTTFKIYLPRMDEDAAGEKGTRATSLPPKQEEAGGTLLVVEDDEMVRDLARRVLEEEGYDVLAARGGAEALDVLEDHDGSLRLLVTDVVMPGDNGDILSERLRQLYPRLKVLYMSGYSDREIGDLDRPPDKVDFLSKPFSVVDLQRAVRDLLD
ncbi:MAG: PAS domain S-box protein [Anaerolineae bacterium]